MQLKMNSLIILIISCLAVLALIEPASAQCDMCMDGMPMDGCPYPEFCGFAPLTCKGCSSSNFLSNLFDDKCMGCANVTCGPKCMDGMPMPGCQDPGACGFVPTPCVGCIVGQSQPGCPDPTNCRPCTGSGPECAVYDTPKCWGCVPGRITEYCPKPGKAVCLHDYTFPCVGCVNGTVSDSCPDPNFCGYEPACLGCVVGKNRPTCPNITACGGHSTLPCINCMNGMAMPPGCPDPGFCGFTPIAESSCMMQMVFGASSEVCVFLSDWNVTSGGEWVALAICVFAASLLREFLMIHRQHRIRQRKFERMEARQAGVNINGNAVSAQSKSEPLMGEKATPTPGFLSLVGHDFGTHLIDSSYYLCNLILAYLLMLLIMTYNIGVCLIVVISAFFAHLFVTVSFAALWKRDAARRKAADGPARVDEFKQSEDPCCADSVYDFED